jgi:hypothetical protein
METFHGSYELIASNYMEVLDVLSVDGKAKVGQWKEEDDIPTSGLFGRQTFCRDTQNLSVSSSLLSIKYTVRCIITFARLSKNTAFAKGTLNPTE